jgi:hypothetical protein
MVDWAGHAGQSTASRYRTMAERQLQGVSPTYERLCLGVAGDARLIALLDGLPAPKRQPNLLLGAVRFLGGPVDSYPAFRRWVIEHWDELEATMLVRRTHVRDDEDVRWLESLIWPEQSDRVQVLHEAVSLARRDPVPVERGDLLTDLPALASRAPADATLVVFHSAVLAYLAEADRRRFRDQVERLAAERPTVWLSNEGPGVVVGVAEPAGPVPFVLARDGVALATADPHGAWLRWLGS